MEPFAAGTHIYFQNLGNVDGRKTNIYEVTSKDGGYLLGTIRWYSRWRKYCFYPVEGTIYEETCLREISQFLEDQTAIQREMVAARRKAAKA